MFLPPDYPEGVAEQYTRYRMWALMETAADYPKAIAMSMAFWSGVYGVGDASRTAMQAVLIDVFLVSVDAVVGLFSGLPIISERLNYAGPQWRLYSGVLGIRSMRQAVVSTRATFFILPAHHFIRHVVCVRWDLRQIHQCGH